MKNLSLVLVIALILIGLNATAQTGTLQGKVYRDMDGKQESIYLPIVKLTQNGLKKVGQSLNSSYKCNF